MRSLGVMLVMAVGATGTASAADSESFIGRVRENMGFLRGDEMTASESWRGAEVSTTSDSFIAHVQESLGLERAIGGQRAEPPTGGPSWSFIAMVQESEGFGPIHAAVSDAQVSREQLRLVQRTLSQRGFPTELTGEFDQGTRDSLAAFQHSRQLPESGMLDSSTMDALGVDVGQVMPVRGNQ